jgi:hypothetical protein
VERRFRVNTPAVASEIIDGEAVIMNLKSGSYFSTREVGSLLWAWLDQGIPESVIVHSLHAAGEAPLETVSREVRRFIDELLKHDLIRELPADRCGTPPTPNGASPTTFKFAPPVLEVYNDMQDLLLLDPIHDVDEAVGWPSPKPPEASAG